MEKALELPKWIVGLILALVAVLIATTVLVPSAHALEGGSGFPCPQGESCQPPTGGGGGGGW